jgi:hypothetical protein
MKAKLFTLILSCFFIASLFSQNSINNYKYVIVPYKFDFLKTKNQYQLNDLTKFLFDKYGFEAIMEGSDYPADLMANRCLALKSDVFKDSGMFKTKLKVELKDCNDKIVYTSKIGESRVKEFKTAYNLALRDAFKSIEALNYKYEPNERITSIVTNTSTSDKTEVSKEIQELKKEIADLKKEKKEEPISTDKPKVGSPKIAKQEPKQVVNTKVKEAVNTGKIASTVLYAQAIENGFQLVDNTPKVVYRIKNTNIKDIFLVEGKSALVYKKADIWVIEYYANDTLMQDVLNIKF